MVSERALLPTLYKVLKNLLFLQPPLPRNAGHPLSERGSVKWRSFSECTCWRCDLYRGPRLAHLSPSAPKLKQPISTGWMMSSLLAWMPSMSAVIATTAWDHDVRIFDSGRQQQRDGYGQPTKYGKTRPDPSFQSHSLPFSLAPCTLLLGAWDTHPSPVVVTGVWN